jgi:poly(3-hydroxybutyrate) depolymerase
MGVGGATFASGGSAAPSSGGGGVTGGNPASGGVVDPGRGGGATGGNAQPSGGNGSGAAPSGETGGVSSGGGAGEARGGKSNAGAGGTAGSGGQSDAKGGAGNPAGAGGGSAGGAAKSSGCGAPDPLKSGTSTIDVSGTSREYILKVPDDYDAQRPYKLIFGFHARGGNATQVAGSGNDNYYGLVSRSGGGAIFVSPEGIDAGWRNEDGRDIAFVKAMLSLFNSKLCIDQQRIFATGFSFGGMMSDAIGCAMADVFRAIAPMAGAIPNPEHPYSGCDQPNMQPIAVWMAHGDNDTVVPLADGKDALDIFLKRSQCQAETMPVSPSPCVAYQGCLPDYPVVLCQFSGGHMVPSFAAEGIWDFFDQF